MLSYILWWFDPMCTPIYSLGGLLPFCSIHGKPTHLVFLERTPLIFRLLGMIHSNIKPNPCNVLIFSGRTSPISCIIGELLHLLFLERTSLISSSLLWEDSSHYVIFIEDSSIWYFLKGLLSFFLCLGWLTYIFVMFLHMFSFYSLWNPLLWEDSSQFVVTLEGYVSLRGFISYFPFI